MQGQRGLEKIRNVSTLTQLVGGVVDLNTAVNDSCSAATLMAWKVKVKVALILPSDPFLPSED
jgi:hypothetical protein